jgi:hypothetical protein
MARSAQSVHLSYVKISTISKWSKLSFHLSLPPRSTIGCHQNDFRAYGMFGANRATILRQDLHYLQMEWNEHPLVHRHWVRPKWFLSLWYVWHKLCTYLALTLTLSANGPKQNSHDPRHLGVTLGSSKMIFEPVVRSAQTIHLSCSRFGLNRGSTWASSPSCIIGSIQNDFWAYG